MSHGLYSVERIAHIEHVYKKWFRVYHGGFTPSIHWIWSGIIPDTKHFNGVSPDHEDVLATRVYKDRTVVLVARPLFLKRDDDGRLHCEDGPAVQWQSGRKEYYLHGAHVERWVVENPHWVPIHRITQEWNAEIRRILIDAYIEKHGHERFIQRMGAIKLNEDEVGILWGVSALHVSGLDFLHTIAEVVNKSPEPDGSYRTYHIMCPPTMRTCKEAIAWTFNMSEKEYELAAES